MKRVFEWSEGKSGATGDVAALVLEALSASAVASRRHLGGSQQTNLQIVIFV